MLTAICIDAHNPGPMTGSGNHTYLLPRAGGRALLIDAGVGDGRHVVELQARLAGMGATLSDVLVTHGHHDHAAGASALASAHRDARFHKWPWPEEDSRVAVDWETLGDGQQFELAPGDPLEAVHMPGHSPDHVVFWHPASATLFCGDLVLPGASVVIQWSRGGDMSQYLDGLRRAIAMGPRRLLPAHGAEVDDPLALLESTLQHRLIRERQIVERLAIAPAVVEAIVESIYHGLAPAHVAAAQENVRAHLEKLQSEERALRRGGRWQLRP